jgi:hypothetical protein
LAARQEIDARSDLIPLGDHDVYAAQGGDDRWKVFALAMYRSRHRRRQHWWVAIATIAISFTSMASSASPLP